MAEITRFPVGQAASGYAPGDFFLVCDWREDLLGKLIQAGSRVRYGDVDLARWSHSGMIVEADGSIVEAEAEGVQLNNISKYTNADLYVVHPTASDEQRALACFYAKTQVGDPYDKLDFVALAFQILFGANLSLHADGRFICSGLVARCTEKYIVGYKRSPETMMPADLAWEWGVKTKQPLPTRDWFDKLLSVLVFVTSPFRAVRNRLHWRHK